MNNVKNKLENTIIDLLSNSFLQSVTKDNLNLHPTRYIDATKSLIGLNLDCPNKPLINFLKNIKLEDVVKKKIDIEYQVRTVSFFELDSAIRNMKRRKSKKIINEMLSLSDGKQIMEFFIELSLLQNGESLLFTWSNYKAMNFIGYSSRGIVQNALNNTVDSLINDSFYNLNTSKEYKLDDVFLNYILDNNQLELIGCLFEINNKNFIRESIIKKNFKYFLNHTRMSFYSRDKIKKDLLSLNLNYKIINQRIDLLDIFNNINPSLDSVLLINALRACMKNMSSINKKIISFYFSQIYQQYQL